MLDRTLLSKRRLQRHSSFAFSRSTQAVRAVHHYSALLTLFPHRLYVPRVLDSDANMHFLHLDGWPALEAVPPFGIREPRPTYDDGTPRQDVLLVRLRACVLDSGLGMVWVHCGWGKKQERSMVVGF